MSRSSRSISAVRLVSALIFALITAVSASAQCSATGTNPSTITFTTASGSSALGQLVTFRVNVADTGGAVGTPTGSVLFTYDGNNFPGGPVTLSAVDAANATASASITILPLGAHTISATYQGDTNFTCATTGDGLNGDGGTITQNVTMGASTTSLMVSAPSQTLGLAVVFTATVKDASGASGSSPTGTVVIADGTTKIASVTLVPVGDNVTSTATFITSILAIGSHTINASYAGDANFGGSSTDGLNGDGSPVPHSVTARTSTTTVPATASITVGSASTVSVTVSDEGASSTSGISTASSAMLTARFGAAAAKLLNGQVLVAGGADGGTNITAFLYDPSGPVFNTTGSLNSGRVGATATLLQDGTVLIAGGSTDGTAGGVTGDTAAEIYNPVNGTFTSVPGATLGTPRFGHTATLLSNGTVLIAGGEDSGGNPLQSTEIYDPVGQTFSPGTATLLQTRFQHTATLLPNGLILMASGDGSGDAELLNPAAVTPPFSVATGSLQAARSAHTATLLADGLVLIAGGSVGGTAVNSLEIYDSIAGAFFSVTTNGTTDNRFLTTPRTGATATLLNDGTVLIVAGQNATPTSLGSAEVYTASYDPQGGISVSSDNGVGPLVGNDALTGCTLTLTGTGATTCGASVTPRHVNNGSHTINAHYDWTSSFAYDLNALIVPIVNNSGPSIFKATTAGTSDSSTEPNWNTAQTAGNTIAEATGTLVWTNIGLSNHVGSNTTAAESLTVNPLPVTLTAISDSKTYDATTTSSKTPTVTGTLLSGDVAVQTFNVKDVTATSFNLTITNGGIDVSADYVITVNNAAATITAKALTETGLSAPSSKIYDATTTAQVNGTATLAAAEAPGAGSTADGIPYSGDNATITGTAVGTYQDAGSNPAKDVGVAVKVAFSGIGVTSTVPGDYTLTIQAAQPATVTPKPLTETGLSAPASKIYDATTTAQVNGTAVLQTAEAPGAGSTGDGIPYTGDSATITGTAVGTYQDAGNNPAKDVGVAVKVAFSGISVTSTVPADYTLTIQSAQPATVTPKALTETGLSVPATKIYDATTGAVVSGTAVLQTAEAAGAGTTADGKPYTGDAVSITGTAVGTYNSKDVSTAATVTFSGISLTGLQNGDYTLTIQAAQSATITPKAVTETGLSVPASKVYDATTGAVVSGTAALQTAEAPGAGTTADGKPYTGDAVSVTGTAVGTYNSKDVSTAATVTFSGISLTGLQNGDYTLTIQAAQSATITPKTLTVSGLTTNPKIYDATTAATLGGAATLAAPEAPGSGTTADGVQYTGDNITLGGVAVGTFVSKNVGTPVNITVSGLTLTNNAAGDYALPVNQQAGLSANITPKTLTVSGLSATAKVYDGTTSAALTGTAALAAAEAPGSGTTADGIQYTGDNITISGTAVGTFVSKNVGTPVNVTVSGLTLANNAAGDYVLPVNQQAGVSANITPATLTYVANPASRNYGAADPAFSGSVTGFVSGENQGNATTGTLIFTTTALVTSNVGSYAINGSGLTANFGNYGFVQAAGNATAYTVNTAPLVITASAASKTYGQTLTLGAGQTGFTTNPGLLPNGDAVGTVTLSSTSGANAATGAAGTYTGDLVPSAPVFSSGLATNYGITFADGTLTVNQRALNVLATAHSADKIYDATQNAAVTFTNDAVNGDIVNVTSTNQFVDRNVGTNKTVNITNLSIVAGGPASNYVLGTIPTTSTANISQRPITVTAAVNTKIYDGTTSAAALPTVTSGALQGADSPNFTEVYDNKNVGSSHVLTASGVVVDGNSGNNYAVTFNTNTGTINQLALTVTAVSFSRVYDNTTTITGPGSAPTLSSAAGGLVGGDTSGFSEAFSSKDAGTGKAIIPSGVAVDGNSGNNYSYTFINNNAGVVTPLGISGTVVANNKVYDGTPTGSVQSCTPVGVLGSDAVTCTALVATFADKNAGTGKVVSIAGVSLSGAQSIDYTIPPTTTATANITPRTLTVTATAANKVYDATTSASINLSDNRVPGDVLTFTDGSSFSDKNVGNGKTVTISNIVISGGADQNNYSLLSPTTTTTANITPAPLTVSASAASKVYDGTATAQVTLSDNHLGSDLVTDSFGAAVFPSKNVGTGLPVSVSGISISGTDSTNYTLQNATANSTASISPRTLTVTATGVNKVYDASLTATVTLSDNRVAGDSLTDSFSTASFASANVGAGIVVTVSGISMSGTDANNYAANTSTTTTAAITPAKTTSTVVSPANTANAAEFMFTATVAPQIAGTPTGTVTFMDNGTPLGAGASGSSTVGLANGTASFTLLVNQLGAGQHTITAVYNKDSNFAAATTQVGTGVTVVAALSVTPGAPISPVSITLLNPTGQDVTYTTVKCNVLSSLGAAVANTLCSVNPPSITVPKNNGTATISVQLATSSSGTAALRMDGLSTLWTAVPAVVFLPFAAPASLRRKLMRRRKLLTILGLALLLAALLFSMGCGGGGFNNPIPLQPGSGTSTTTQPGSYVVQVTGTTANGQTGLASIPFTVGF